MTDLYWQTLEYLRQGGFIMIPLVVVSVVMWVLIVDRLRSFAAWRRADVDKATAVAAVVGGRRGGDSGRMLTSQRGGSGQMLAGERGESAEMLTSQLPGVPDAGSRGSLEATPKLTSLHSPDFDPTTHHGLRATLVRDFLAERTGDPELDRDILGHCALRLVRDLEEHRATIAVLAAVAPLLGLLGTVLGMIETFDVIAIFGTGNSRAMANGIGIALVTTQTGLLVAIPGLLMSNRLGRAAQQLQTSLDETRAALERTLTLKETTR